MHEKKRGRERFHVKKILQYFHSYAPPTESESDLFSVSLGIAEFPIRPNGIVSGGNIVFITGSICISKVHQLEHTYIRINWSKYGPNTLLLTYVLNKRRGEYSHT